MNEQPIEQQDEPQLTILSHPCSHIQFKNYKIGFKQYLQKYEIIVVKIPKIALKIVFILPIIFLLAI